MKRAATRRGSKCGGATPQRAASSIALVLALAGSAAADSASDAATHAAAGKKAFAEAKYAEAIAEFRTANRLQPDPKLLYALAQAQRMAGDCAGAIVSYEEFIKTKFDDKLVEYSQANIVRCKELLATTPKEPVEPIKPITTPPVTVRPEVPPQRDQPSASWTSDWVGHGLVVGGVAAGVVGAIVWSGGRSAALAANDATDHDTFIQKRDAASSAVSHQRIGIAVGVAGIAAIVCGVIHYRLSAKKEVRIGAAASTTGGGVTARFTF